MRPVIWSNVSGIYPVMKKLESKGLIKELNANSEVTNDGRQRKRYGLTKKGRLFLDSSLLLIFDIVSAMIFESYCSAENLPELPLIRMHTDFKTSIFSKGLKLLFSQVDMSFYQKQINSNSPSKIREKKSIIAINHFVLSKQITRDSNKIL